MSLEVIASRTQTADLRSTGAYVADLTVRRSRAEAALTLDVSTLANGTRTLTVTHEHDGIPTDNPVTLTQATATTSAKLNIPIRNLRPGVNAFRVQSSNTSDTAATVVGRVVSPPLPLPAIEDVIRMGGPAARLLFGRACVTFFSDSYGPYSNARANFAQGFYAAGAGGWWAPRGQIEIFGAAHPFSLRNAYTPGPALTSVASGATFPGSGGIVNRLPFASESNWEFSSDLGNFFTSLQQWIPFDDARIPNDPAELKHYTANIAANPPAGSGNRMESADLCLIVHRTPDAITSFYVNPVGTGAGQNGPLVSAAFTPRQEFGVVRHSRSTAWSGGLPYNFQPMPSGADETGRKLYWQGAALIATDRQRGIVWGSGFTIGGGGAANYAYPSDGYRPDGIGNYTDDQLDAFFAAHAAVEASNVAMIHVGTNNGGQSSANFRRDLRVMINRILRIGQRYTSDTFGVVLLTPMPWIDNTGVDQTPAMATRTADIYAVAAEFNQPEAISVVDTHSLIISQLGGPVTTWANTFLVNEGGPYRLHVQPTNSARTAWGTAIRDGLLTAAGVSPQSAATLAANLDGKLTSTRLTRIDGAALETTVATRASQASVDAAAAKLPASGTVPNTTQVATPTNVSAAGTNVLAKLPATGRAASQESVDVIANPKLGVTLRTSGTGFIADISAAGEAISQYSLRIRMLQATPEGARRAVLVSTASVSPTASIVSVTFANASARIAEDLDIVVSATTTESGALPQRRIPWRPGEVAAGNDAVLDAIAGIEVGGGQPVKPTVVHPQHVWRFDANRPSARAKDIVEVPVGFAGWLAFEPPLNGGTGVSAVSSVTIGASATGLTELAPSGDFRQAVFKTAARNTAGTFAVSAVITTTDGQTLPLAATLKVV